MGSETNRSLGFSWRLGAQAPTANNRLRVATYFIARSVLAAVGAG